MSNIWIEKAPSADVLVEGRGVVEHLVHIGGAASNPPCSIEREAYADSLRRRCPTRRCPR